MKYFPKNTLAYFNAAPHFAAKALGGVDTVVLASATKLYRISCGMVSPELEAVRFYSLNHCASIVRGLFTLNEPLPPWALKVMNAYLDTTVQQAERLTHYIISIITREARHLHAPSATLEKAVIAKFGQPMMTFLKNNCSAHESAAVAAYMTSPPQATLAQYAGALAHVFDHGKWSGGFGGKPWGMIAKTLLSMIEGHTTMEMMIDTAYTLAHNNGPMFNKGMMYEHHGNPFLMILDVQRSGQIPELLLDTINHTGLGLPLDLKQIVAEVKTERPGEFGAYVDWFKVEKLGALNSYSSQKAAQKKAHPVNVVTTFMGKPAKLIGEFMVTPNQSVGLYERKAA